MKYYQAYLIAGVTNAWQLFGLLRKDHNDISEKTFVEVQPEKLLDVQEEPKPLVVSDNDEDMIDVYFGAGCCWHMQHVFVGAERTFLGRSDDEITALAGYAGGSKSGEGLDGQLAVCYHNSKNVAVYGDLGHAEVVGVKIPSENYGNFASVLFGILDKNGDRPDKGDRGLEYRSLVGLPGGVNSPLYETLVKVADGLVDLPAGEGDDADTLRKKNMWVMDSDKFAFW